MHQKGSWLRLIWSANHPAPEIPNRRLGTQQPVSPEIQFFGRCPEVHNRALDMQLREAIHQFRFHDGKDSPVMTAHEAGKLLEFAFLDASQNLHIEFSLKNPSRKTGNNRFTTAKKMIPDGPSAKLTQQEQQDVLSGALDGRP